MNGILNLKNNLSTETIVVELKKITMIVSSSVSLPFSPAALCPPASCPPATSSVPGGTKQSRSGRVIRPPLDYWRGGRTVLDSDLNVTVYSCYETSVCKPVGFQ